MTLVIFGIGVLVFFITVYGTVVAGGLRLTVRQLDETPELAHAVQSAGDDDLTTRDIVNAEF